MVLNNKDFEVIDATSEEFFRGGNITQKCPRCGADMIVNTRNGSYEVRCKSEGCIAETFRGI